jgi:hypothetical protein
MGECLIWALKIHKLPQFFGCVFPRHKLCVFLDTKGLGNNSERFFSQTHLVTLNISQNRLSVLRLRGWGWQKNFSKIITLTPGLLGSYLEPNDGRSDFRVDGGALVLGALGVELAAAVPIVGRP